MNNFKKKEKKSVVWNHFVCFICLFFWGGGVNNFKKKKKCMKSFCLFYLPFFFFGGGGGYRLRFKTKSVIRLCVMGHLSQEMSCPNFDAIETKIIFFDFLKIFFTESKLRFSLFYSRKKERQKKQRQRNGTKNILMQFSQHTLLNHSVEWFFPLYPAPKVISLEVTRWRGSDVTAGRNYDAIAVWNSGVIVGRNCDVIPGRKEDGRFILIVIIK